MLRSAIREYLCCEAMQDSASTTRALCLVGSDEKSLPRAGETGATIVRMAPSHVRFGVLKSSIAGSSMSTCSALADYVIEMHFPTSLPTPTGISGFAGWSSARRHSCAVAGGGNGRMAC